MVAVTLQVPAVARVTVVAVLVHPVPVTVKVLVPVPDPPLDVSVTTVARTLLSVVFETVNVSCAVSVAKALCGRAAPKRTTAPAEAAIRIGRRRRDFIVVLMCAPLREVNGRPHFWDAFTL